MNDRLLALSCLSALKILSLKEIAFERFLHATPVFLYLIAHPDQFTLSTALCQRINDQRKSGSR
jgi:hypothetical protein